MMIKYKTPTKIAKKTIVKFIKSECWISNYTCPCCKITYVGGVSKKVTRFKCDCGQEIIVQTK